MNQADFPVRIEPVPGQSGLPPAAGARTPVAFVAPLPVRRFGAPVRISLSPRDTTFFDLFAASAAHLVVGANLLSEMLGADLPGRTEIAEKLRTAEHDADEATHAIMSHVNSTFVTPFDREDIYRLASNLDDVMDEMEAAAD